MHKKAIFCIFFFCFISSGCSGLNPLKKLQGKWTSAGAMDDYHTWYLEYTITGNHYKMVGYPPISEEGFLKLKETKGDSMLIEFRIQKSDPVYKNHGEWIYVTGNTFTMNGNTYNKSIYEKKDN
jgi:hypothetical protein